jgi:soluble lytic murein transglycosylase-like protein
MKKILFFSLSTLGIILAMSGGYETMKTFSTIQYYDLIKSVKRRNGWEHIPNALTLATIDTESSFQADAIKEEANDNSYGLMQILHGTARDMGFQGDPEDLLDPETNIKWGTAYQNWLYKRYNDFDAVIHAYNEGPGNYDKGKRVPTYYGRVKARWAKWEALISAGDVL